MGTFEMNGFTLDGAEYWPYVGAEDIDYPDAILWGFYPEKDVDFEGTPNPDTPTDAAMDCAHIAYDELRGFLAAPPPELQQAVGGSVTNRFYLWVNDYTRAADPYPPGVRPSRLWYWTRNPPVEGRIPGFWKWEATVTHDGTCTTPQPDQIAKYLAEL